MGDMSAVRVELVVRWERGGERNWSGDGPNNLFI